MSPEKTHTTVRVALSQARGTATSLLNSSPEKKVLRPSPLRHARAPQKMGFDPQLQSDNRLHEESRQALGRRRSWVHAAEGRRPRPLSPRSATETQSPPTRAVERRDRTKDSARNLDRRLGGEDFGITPSTAVVPDRFLRFLLRAGGIWKKGGFSFFFFFFHIF